MLATKLTHLFPDIDFLVDCKLQDDGNGPYIATWNRPEPQPSQAEIDAVAVPALKQFKLSQIRAEAKTRIEAIYPQWRQLDAALGLLPGTYVEQMRSDIGAIIQASNTAEDAVDAAATLEAIDAVEVVWP